MNAASSTYEFTMRSSDVTVSAEFIPSTGPYPITVASDIEHGTVVADKTEAVYDEEVELTVTPDTDPTEGMYVLKDLTVMGSDGKVSVTRPENQNTNYAFSIYSFRMPASAVTVNAVFYLPHPVTISENIEHGRVESNQESAGEGDPVTLTVTPEEGYKLKALTVTDANGTLIAPVQDEQDAAKYTFAMPARAVTVSAEFEAVSATPTPTVTPTPTPPNLTPTPAPTPTDPTPGPCYVATAVYGSYDCPEVWTLRRFRDEVLAKTWYGRLFIHLYYAVSPTAVKLFGDSHWFQSFFRNRLDKMVSGLQANGFESTPYEDRAW